MVLSSRVSDGAVLVSILVAALLPVSTAEANAIVNGDFSAGNTGFSSDYIHVQPPVAENMVEARYTVWTDPNDVHSKWVSMGDHTTGTGKMLIANGAGSANTLIWSQDVMLSTGTTYQFSAWATGVYSSMPAHLSFDIGETSLGTLPLTETVPDWIPFTREFTVLTGGPAQLAIRDLETISIGNDFALDDISLTIIPEPTIFHLVWSMLGMLIFFRCRR